MLLQKQIFPNPCDDWSDRVHVNVQSLADRAVAPCWHQNIQDQRSSPTCETVSIAT